MDLLPAWRFIALPNLVSYLGLAASAASIACADAGNMHATAALWAIAAGADNIDGAFARLFDRPPALKAFGSELDSLCDAVGFGLAPIAGIWLLTPAHGPLLAIVSFAYLLALITRLGHFNLADRAGATGFSGIPSTWAALLIATLALVPGGLGWAWLALPILAVCMLAPIPMPRPRGRVAVVLVIWCVVVPSVHLWRAVL